MRTGRHQLTPAELQMYRDEVGHTPPVALFVAVRLKSTQDAAEELHDATVRLLGALRVLLPDDRYTLRLIYAVDPEETHDE